MSTTTHLKGLKETVSDIDRVRVGSHEEVALDHGHQILFIKSTATSVGRLSAVLLMQLIQPSFRSKNGARKDPYLSIGKWPFEKGKRPL